MKKHVPIKTVKFNKRKHKRTKWIMSGINKSINNLYRKLKETTPDSPLYYQYKTNLRTLNIILKRKYFHSKKKQYYDTCFEKCKNDMKNTWTILVDI